MYPYVPRIIPTAVVGSNVGAATVDAEDET
jgi:hypothetical protein